MRFSGARLVEKITRASKGRAKLLPVCSLTKSTWLSSGEVQRLGGTPGNDLRPAWITPGGVYAAWLGEAAIGAAGVILFLRGRTAIGLALIAIYAVLGFGGFDHYTLAAISAHTLAMNLTIWLEAATGLALLAYTASYLRLRAAKNRVPA